MIEFFTFAFTPAVAVFSMLLGVVVLYWLIFIMGALDLDCLDFDIDIDVDGDVGGFEGDVDANIVPDAGGVGQAMLAFFYVGQVPVTILVTLITSSMWMIAMLANHHLNPSGGFWLGLPIAGGTLVASMFVVKIIGWPIGRVFKALHANPDQIVSVVGSLCKVVSETVSSELGQAEVDTKGSPVTMNVITKNGEVLAKGAEAVVLERDAARNIYIIAPVDLENK